MYIYELLYMYVQNMYRALILKRSKKKNQKITCLKELFLNFFYAT